MGYTYEGPNLFLNPRVVVFLPDIHRATRPWGNLTAHKQYPLSRHKHYMDFFACRHAECTGGLVAEYNPATVETRVRFPVGASCFVFMGASHALVEQRRADGRAADRTDRGRGAWADGRRMGGRAGGTMGGWEVHGEKVDVGRIRTCAGNAQ